VRADPRFLRLFGVIGEAMTGESIRPGKAE